jgi:hypothetical protein
VSPFLKRRSIWPLRELARWWRIPGHTADDVILGLVDAGLAGELVLQSHFDDLAEGTALDPEALLASLRNQLAAAPYGGSVRHEKLLLADALAVRPADLAALAQRYGLPLPEGWAPEPPATQTASVRPTRPDRGAAEAMLTQFLERKLAEKPAGKPATRAELRQFARDNGIPVTLADEVKRKVFPGKGGRPPGAQ